MKFFKRFWEKKGTIAIILIGVFRTLIGTTLWIASLLGPVLIFVDIIGKSVVGQSFLMTIFIIIKALMISGTLFIIGMLLTDFMLPNIVKELIYEEMM